ncbi:hypothetical protein [Pseudodesulfovibrio sp. zrk46]|uniref:hypothetical protein n=1 Tax=Pseudodesulfovibrio sp. zrk46 TaxID=2725288 RepID=UPI001449BC21|nr:hypothetical protein [Pseudodesulfovibrio sp. zrk46]QJB58082.1 hypothetical protein HFN16_17580 [Pseudodesulfovibrio sp. zrk46]
MFGRILVNMCLATILLFTLGCGAFSSSESGMEPTKTVELEENFELSVKIEKEGLLGVEMPDPVKSGYKLTGASFDPKILGLVNYLEFDNDGQRWVQYMFKPVDDGTSDILFKMAPISGGDAEIYKRLTVNVGKDDTFF